MKLFLTLNLAFVFAFTSQTAFADQEMGLSDLSESTNTTNTELKPNPEQPKLEIKHTETESKIFRLKFIVGYTLASDSSNGQGITSDLSSDLGYFLSPEAFIEPQNTIYSFSVKYRRSRVKFSKISGVVPNQIVHTKNEYFLDGYISPFSGTSSFFDTLKIGVGYSYQSREVDQTTPNAVITNLRFSALTVNAKHEYSITQSFDLLSSLRIFIPISLQESGSTTGSYNSGYGFEFEPSLGYKLSSIVDLDFSPYLQIQYLNFTGVGSRGTQNSTNRMTSYGFPIGLRFHF